MKIYSLIALCWLIGGPIFAAKVDTLIISSQVMKKDIKAVVVTPDSYRKEGEALPVVYLLHGYSGNYGDWIRKAPTIQQLADQYNLMIVCPDGGFSSWYFDSPQDPAFRYETYIAKELVGWVDQHYHTIAQPAGRAITGLSMGGHGALYLAFRHLDVFGAAGSMSGGVDIRPFPNNWEIKSRLGNFSEYPENWEKNSVVNMLHLIAGKNLSLMIDCGTEDFFFQVNEHLHQSLKAFNIPHDYITRPGQHNWQYWENAVQYQLLFFARKWGRK